MADTEIEEVFCETCAQSGVPVRNGKKVRHFYRGRFNPEDGPRDFPRRLKCPASGAVMNINNTRL